jgi:hypothetical protein
VSLPISGVLSLDRINSIAYVNISERAHPYMAQLWTEAMVYKELVTFKAFDGAGRPMYHTNVMMSVGHEVAIVCPEAVPDRKERQHLLVSMGTQGRVWRCVRNH